MIFKRLDLPAVPSLIEQALVLWDWYEGGAQGEQPFQIARRLGYTNCSYPSKLNAQLKKLSEEGVVDRHRDGPTYVYYLPGRRKEIV